MKYLFLLITFCSCSNSSYYSQKQVNSIVFEKQPKELRKLDSIDSISNHNINTSYDLFQ